MEVYHKMKDKQVQSKSYLKRVAIMTQAINAANAATLSNNKVVGKKKPTKKKVKKTKK